MIMCEAKLLFFYFLTFTAYFSILLVLFHISSEDTKRYAMKRVRETKTPLYYKG